MGVSGAGKSTVARALADRLKWAFAEGDEFHPESNVEKMTAGVPLTDADRAPWLRALARWTNERDASGEPTVLSCSALRRRYRNVLASDLPGTLFIHLTVDAATLLQRMGGRQHFMPVDLLQSQLETLEPLASDERGRCFDAGVPPEQMVDSILATLGLDPAR